MEDSSWYFTAAIVDSKENIAQVSIHNAPDHLNSSQGDLAISRNWMEYIEFKNSEGPAKKRSFIIAANSRFCRRWSAAVILYRRLPKRLSLQCRQLTRLSDPSKKRVKKTGTSPDF